MYDTWLIQTKTYQLSIITNDGPDFQFFFQPLTYWISRIFSNTLLILSPKCPTEQLVWFFFSQNS